MNGLGFRPLRYKDGTGPEGASKVATQMGRGPAAQMMAASKPPTMTHENAMIYIKWIHGEGIENLPPSERMGLNSLAAAMEGWLSNPGAAIDYATRLQNLIESPRPVDTMGLYPTELPRPSGRDLEMEGNLGRMIGPSVSRPVDTMGLYPTEMEGNLGRMIPGSSVSRPVEMDLEMGGNLGRMTGPSVSRPSDRVLEMEGNLGRLRGYAHGGYASRGTVAGELPRYGDMSVREEGETMRELSKRHRDQDWYNRMGGGLGSLRRRVA